ncbi:uncharacterized protein PAE49_021621 isoform 1-T1 [Odontesthes bonariensis]
MVKLQMSVTCVFLQMMVDQGILAFCPKCEPGYFVIRNCSWTGDVFIGIQCELCQNCLAHHMEIVVPCSDYANSVCGIRSTTTVAMTTINPTSESSPDMWIMITAVSASMSLLLLVGLFFTLLSCRKSSYYKCMELLPLKSVHLGPEPRPSCDLPAGPSLP